MKSSILMMSLMLLVFSAHARLGESPSQISARYGAMKGAPEVIGTNLWMGTFHHRSFDIVVTFWNGKSAKEEFTDLGKDIPADDALALFSSVSGDDGKVISKRLGVADSKHTMIDYMDTANGVTGQLYDDGINSGSLTVISKDYQDFVWKQIDEEKKKHLQGF